VLRLLLLVASIALADAVNPGTLAPAFYLATRARAVRRLASFAGAFFAVNFAGGVLIVLGPGQLILAALPHPHRTARFVIEIAIGAVLIAIGAYLLARRRERSNQVNIPSLGGRGTAALGASIAAVELPTALPYFAALAAIIGSGVSLASQLLLVAAFNLVFISPVLAMIGALLIAGERAGRALRRAGDWVRSNWRPALGSLAVAAGVLLLGFGAAGLAGLR
jgi:cytochrome c biogenesis protein CcdA